MSAAAETTAPSGPPEPPGQLEPSGPPELRHLTGAGRFVADLPAPGALHAAFVRSPLPHALLGGVDTAGVAGTDGVVAVFTATDVPVPPLAPYPPLLEQRMPQPLLATDRVRYAGEPVALVLAGNERQARLAARALRDRLELQPLPPLVDPVAAATDPLLLHPEAGTNTALTLTFARPVRGELFAGCQVVVEQELTNQRVAAAALEPRALLARVDGDRVALWGGSQAPALWRDRIAEGLGMPAERLRVIAPDVGGSFGSKALPGVEELLLVWVALRLGRDVRWREERSENLLALGHGRGQRQTVRIGGDRDGRIIAYQLAVTQDCGAYPRIGGLLPVWTKTMLTGPYAIERARFTATSVVTTTAPVVAYRGAGQPEAVAALERAVDLFAAAIGWDPARLRLANLIRPEAMPYLSVTRSRYDGGDYPAALRQLLETAGYEQLRREQRRRRDAGDPLALGIGISSFVEVTGGDVRPETARLRLRRDGRVSLAVGTAPQGQGHQATWRQLAAARLGLAPERVDVVDADSAAVPDGAGTGGSRSAQTAGPAVAGAADALVAAAAAVLARQHGAEVAEVVHDAATGSFGIAGQPRRWGWREVAELAGTGAGPAGTGPAGAEELVVEHRYTPTGGTYPYGSHLAVVEVDTGTGAVRLLRYLAVDDSGTLLQPVIAEGQLRGGLAQGVGQALFEEFGYHRDGTPVSTTLQGCGVPSAADLPEWDTRFRPTASAVNPLGVRGVGESGALAAPPAVVNAAVDALAHLGVRHLEMPLTPERVWRALGEAHSS